MYAVNILYASRAVVVNTLTNALFLCAVVQKW